MHNLVHTNCYICNIIEIKFYNHQMSCTFHFLIFYSLKPKYLQAKESTDPADIKLRIDAPESADNAVEVY